MKPALTPEEWASVGDAADNAFFFGGARVRVREDPHATAAVCLHGQPFGFTREDVAVIRDACEAINSEWGPYSGDPGDAMHYHGTGAGIPRLLDLADRIEALLPPEVPALPEPTR